MYKQIGHLLRDHKDEEVDKKFILDVFEIMASHDDLEGYADKVTFDDNEFFGLFDGDRATININIDRINRLNKTNYKKRLNTLLILRHEVEHARNLKKTAVSDGVEASILRLSMFVASKAKEASLGITKPEDTLVSSLYRLNPNERIADIRSSKFMINLLKNNRGSEELIKSREFLYWDYIRGYRDNGITIDPPTYLFLINSGFFRYYCGLVRVVSEHEPYSLDTRVLCGLPITREEKELTLLNKAGLKEIPKK